MSDIEHRLFMIMANMARMELEKFDRLLTKCLERGTSDCCDTGMGNGIDRESI